MRIISNYRAFAMYQGWFKCFTRIISFHSLNNWHEVTAFISFSSQMIKVRCREVYMPKITQLVGDAGRLWILEVVSRAFAQKQGTHTLPLYLPPSSLAEISAASYPPSYPNCPWSVNWPLHNHQKTALITSFSSQSLSRALRFSGWWCPGSSNWPIIPCTVWLLPASLQPVSH